MTFTESQGKQRLFYLASGRKYYWLKYKLAENGHYPAFTAVSRYLTEKLAG